MKEITKEKEKIKRKYLDSATEIVRDYNQELEITSDYEGRQIFELLQNADDEATDELGRVHISFDGSVLTVSNTGSPFTLKGVSSLLRPNSSPKQIYANKIGCKGLGFRSILSWAKEVVVSSEDFTIGFSKENAIEFYNSIISEKPSLLNDIRELSKEEYPVAVLSSPKILNKSRIEKGYSTSIIIICKDELSDKINEQIQELEFEELVFLHNLKEVIIDCNDYHKTFTKVCENDDVIIEEKDNTSGESESASWHIYNKNGTVKDDKGNDRDYEFKIAYDRTADHGGKVLYSYFKTDVQLEFPAIIHGTFELTEDRNSVKKGSKVNEQLFELLSDFMIETAVQIAENNNECNYDPLDLVVSPNIDSVLNSAFNFENKLKAKARTKKILPTIDNRYISLEESPFYSRYGFDEIVNPKAFSSLLKCCNADTYSYYEDIEDYIQNELEIDFYDYADFCEIINSDLDYYSKEDKINLIGLIEKEYRTQKSPEVFPHLLDDTNGNHITDLSRVYPLPSDDNYIELPKWVEIKFLNSEMEQDLLKYYDLGGNKRELAKKLSRYNMDEYSFDRVLRTVVNQKVIDETSHEKYSDIIKWLWNYYVSVSSRVDLSKDNINVRLICEDGTIANAKDCYIGKDFGNDLGERIVKIYSNSFISKKLLNVDFQDHNDVMDFLEWLGASKFPKIIHTSNIGDIRNDYIDVCYPLYVSRDNKSYSKSEFTHNDVSRVEIDTVEHLDEILEKADFNDILAWFLSDNILYSRLTNNFDYEIHPGSKIIGYPGLVKIERIVSHNYIKSFLKFKLSTAQWIVNKEGKKVSPKNACFDDLGLDPLVVFPAVNYSYIKQIIGKSSKKEVDALLSKLGVAEDFSKLDKHVIYSVLIQLPGFDQDYQKGKSIYRKLVRDIENIDELINENPEYDSFIKNGLILTKRGDIKRYVPVSSARYTDKKIFSKQILKDIDLVEIDAKSGEERIAKLFGVKPLKSIQVGLQSEPELHSLNEKFQKDYLSFLPFVLACRISYSSKTKDCKRLIKTKVTLCNSAEVEYKVEGKTGTCFLADYEEVYLKSENKAFIKVPEDCNNYEQLKQRLYFRDSLCDVISAILEVNEDKSFFRELFINSNQDREFQLRKDKGDDNLEWLNAAKKMLKINTDGEYDFWSTIAELLKTNVLDEDNVVDIKKRLDAPFDIDDGIDFENINNISNAETIINIFKYFGIDISSYNSIQINEIHLKDYWLSQIKQFSINYRQKYIAYLYDELKDSENNTDEYEEYIKAYDFGFDEIEVENSINVDLKKLYEEALGVSVEEIQKHSVESVEKLLADEKEKLSKEEQSFLKSKYSESRIEAFLLFGKVKELLNPNKDADNIEIKDEEITKPTIQLIDDVLSRSPQGFINVKIVSPDNSNKKGTSALKHSGTKKTFSRQSEKAKQADGLTGEIIVYKELKEIYSKVDWVSGNAEKANQISKGDDSCGYDMRYIDESGKTQYVEVKASKGEDISFILSDNELRFASENCNCYEVIFVRLFDDGTPKESLRLGHLFELDEGEDIFHNSRFSIESKEYSIHAVVD